MAKRKEEKLARKAAKALMKLDRYRRKHAPAAGAAAKNIAVTARLAGWDEASARQAACLMLAAGVDPQRAACLFHDTLEHTQ